MEKYNSAQNNSRHKLVEKILSETGADLPMSIWSEMSEEELNAYYQDLRSKEKCGVVVSDVAESTSTAAESICNLRSLTGLSQQAFSDKYEIPKRTIEDWERGRRSRQNTWLNCSKELSKGTSKRRAELSALLIFLGEPVHCCVNYGFF